MNETTLLPYFPIPFAGETVYSLVSRFALRSRLPDTYVLKLLTNQKNKTTLLSVLPGYLGSMSNTLPKGHPWRNPEEIVRNHTAIPYFLYFDSLEQRDLWILRLATCDSSLPIIMALGIIEYSCVRSRNTFFCSRCVEEDKANLGVSYFRREHQLPYVAVCWRHGERLWHGCSVCGQYPIKNRGLCMPGKCLCGNIKTPLPAFPSLPSNLPMLRWIAEESAYMVNAQQTNSRDIRSELKLLAIRHGFRRGSLLDYYKLAAAIESHYGRETLQWLGAPAWQADKPSPWLRRLFTTHEPRRSPAIYFLIVIGLLFETVDAFENGVKNLYSESSLRISVEHKQSPLPKNSKNSIENLKAVLEDNDFKLTRVAGLLGIPVHALIVAIRQQSICIPLSKDTKKRVGENKLLKIIETLSAGHPKKEICRRYQIGQWTLILIELSNPALNFRHRQAAKLKIREKNRDRLRSFISKHTNVSRSIIFKCLPGLYDYMLTSDKEWFYEQLPKLKPSGRRERKTTDWISYDNKKAEELIEVFTNLFAGDKKPIFASKNCGLKRINILSKYYSNPARFPMVNDVLNDMVESRFEFQKRRIRWAMEQIKNNDSKLSMDNLRRTASFPAKTIWERRQFVLDVAHQINLEISEQSVFIRIIETNHLTRNEESTV